MALEKGILQANWDFVPVGNRVRFDLTFLIERATKWGLINWDHGTLKYYWFTKPILDLQPVLVLMNHGRFAGSSLHAFSEKESGARVPILYRAGKYKDIVEYCAKEHEEALKLLHDAREVLSKFGDGRRRPAGEAKP